MSKKIIRSRVANLNEPEKGLVVMKNRNAYMRSLMEGYVPNDADITMGSHDFDQFDARLSHLRENVKESKNLDIFKDDDMAKYISSKDNQREFKQAMLLPIHEAFTEIIGTSETNSEEDKLHTEHVNKMFDTVNLLWDTKMKLFENTQTMIPGKLVNHRLEYPVLLKQFYRSIIKDIIPIKPVDSPLIRKHISSWFMVDNATGDAYEYPKCLFDGTWERIHEAGRGHKISEEVVPLQDGRLVNFDIIAQRTDGVPGKDILGWNVRISAIQVGTEIHKLRGNGITIDYSTGGLLVNGDKISGNYNGTLINDEISGRVDSEKGTINLSVFTGQITGVVFSGYLTNKQNLRTVSVREIRDLINFTVEEGPRSVMSFTKEDIDDAAALMDMNFINRMTNEIVRTQEMQETMSVIRFYDNEFEKYNSLETDIFNLESIAPTAYVDLAPPANFAGDPFMYYSSVVQFRLSALFHDLIDAVKLDSLEFQLVGNPKATMILKEFIKWKITSSDNMGGLKVNGSYGFMTSGEFNVRCVSSNLYDAYTEGNDEVTGKRELTLRIMAFPTTEEHMSFAHLRYTNEIFTSQSQTAYQDIHAEGGAYQIITAFSRFVSVSVQGIQSRLIMRNSEKIYGPAPRFRPFNIDDEGMGGTFTA